VLGRAENSYCSPEDTLSLLSLFHSTLLIPEVALRPHYFFPGTKGSWRDRRGCLEFRYSRDRAIFHLSVTPVETVVLLLRASFASLRSPPADRGSNLIARRP